MKVEKETVEKYLNNETSLQRTFTTGYREDLELAREIVRRRRNGGEAPQGTKVPGEEH